jgi:hypothetical protein
MTEKTTIGAEKTGTKQPPIQKNTNGKPYYSDYTRSNYDSSKFIKLIEKRLRKELRSQTTFSTKMLKTNTYVFHDEEKLSTKIMILLLKRIFGKIIVLKPSQSEITKESTEKQTRKEIHLISDSLDEFITKRLDVFFNNNKLELLYDKNIYPMKCITSSEMKALGEIFSLEGKTPKNESTFISELQKRYPQTKTSLLKSFEFINKMN